MTTDIEHELRELLHERAAGAPTAVPATPAAAPQEILRRGRLHQIGTVLGSALIAGLLVVGSVAGLQALLGEPGFETGPPGYDVFERTASVEAFTVTGPSDWFLVNEWPLSLQTVVSVGSNSASGSGSCTIDTAGTQTCSAAPEPSPQPVPVPPGLPMLQLSNVDLGLDATACGQQVPSGAAVMYVALDQDRAAAGVDPTLRPFPPEPGPPPAGTGPCGPGRYSHFTVNGTPFFVWIGLGADVSGDDQASVFRAFEMMSADEGWTLRQPDETTPAYVIAAGVTPGGPWRLELRPSEANVELSLQGVGPFERVGDFTVPDVPIEANPCCASPISFGAISKEAEGVGFRPSDGGSSIAGTVVPLPPTLPYDFDLFFIEGTAGLRGTPVAVGLANVPVSPPPSGGSRENEVELSGSFQGRSWSVRFTGSFANETECMDLAVSGDTTTLCPTDDALRGAQPFVHGYDGDGIHLLAGSVPSDIVDIRFTSEDGSSPPSDARCAAGPSGWTDPDRNVCAIALPSQGSGTLEYVDAGGRILFQNGIGWGSASASAPPPVSTGVPAWVQPTHGGTYWAVYAWVGDPGDPIAEKVSQMLLDRFGIEAFPGDLACDQGAAEALGTNAEQGIAVYFDTHEDANAFALQAGLLGHEADPVIARVTTYCLD